MVNVFPERSELLEEAIGKKEFKSEAGTEFFAFIQPLGGSYEIQRVRENESWTFRFNGKGELLGCFMNKKEGIAELIFDQASGYGQKHRAQEETRELFRELEGGLGEFRSI